MLIDFFLHLRAQGVSASVTEFLTLLEGLHSGICNYSSDNFYYFARSCLVKDESLYDRFDLAFGQFFKGLTQPTDDSRLLPEDWLRAMAQKHLSAEEKAKLDKLGWDQLMEKLRERLEEQKERHQGGSKWIGTGGTSPFGNSGYHPEGIRIGGPSAGHRTAVKVWEKREFRNLDDQVELGTRNIKVALRRLRRFAREGAAEELDLEETIRSTAENAGWLHVKMRPERHNAVKVLLFFDVGGSMDDHVRTCEELFSACRSEFKHLEYFYFHNCIYETVWHNSLRRHDERLAMHDILHTYGDDYKVIIVGDATMSPYEVMQPFGSVEHMNPEPGAIWLQRLLRTWPATVWLNPEPQQFWPYRQSIQIIRDLMSERMFPTTVAGIEEAMRNLTRKK